MNRKAVIAFMAGVLALGTTAMAEDSQILVPTEDGQAEVLDETGKESTAWYVRRSGKEEWQEIQTGAEEQKNEADTETEAAENTEVEAETENVAEQNLYDLKMTDKDKKSYIWYGLALEDIQDVKVGVTEKDQVFEKYVTADKKENIDTTDYAVTTWEETKEVYNTSDLNMRQFPDQEAEILEILDFGNKLEACGELDGWYLVYADGRFGYVASDYITEDSSKLEELQASMQTEAQQWETEGYAEQNTSSSQSSSIEEKQPETSAPETTAPETSAPETSAPETSAPETAAPETSAPETAAPETAAPETAAPETQRVEVSRENVADCNDPDHGTTYITYSDGSVDVEEY